ncbi:MAG: hypothetical protein IRZ31_07465 [Thermogemmatispora sp.]|uniref:GAP1-N2 domain-containing protein n=1 Tax=Thermogemmatispora sp. TaxID=1968838 RepID=UPI00262DD06A|nr:hypothetical protein [Thermogemmatispora sp.]MBX5456725.1 hypothetical protein [Thermogemmatispora sp.]
MNQQAASLQPIEQLWYTWSDRGLESALAAGYRVRACSPGLSSEGRLEQLRPYLRYQLPADTNLTSLKIEEAPRALALIQSGNERLLLHKVYVGRDGAGRPGNYFVHLLAGLEPTFSADRAICLWRYHDDLLWQTSDDPRHGITLPAIPRSELEQRLRARWRLAYGPGVAPRGPEFILLSESERSAALEFLPWLLLAFFDQQERYDSAQAQREAAKAASQLRRGGREALAGEGQTEAGIPPIYLIATPDQAAWLVWALMQLLPPALGRRLTFSTYEESSDLSDSRVIRQAFALVTTCPGRPEQAANCLSERLYREAWTFNLFAGLPASPSLRELPEARDFVELAYAAFRGGDLRSVEQLHRDLEGGVTDVHSFLQEYRRWRSNQGSLTLDKIAEITRYHPLDWSQLMVRRQVLQRLCDDHQGEALLDQILADLRALAERRRQEARLDQALVSFENEARDLWRSTRLSAATRVRLLLALDALGMERSLLGEAVRGVLDDPLAHSVLRERPGRCSGVLACAARALSRSEAERYREVVGELLTGYRNWEDCRSLLRLVLVLPGAWRGQCLHLFRRVLTDPVAASGGGPLPLAEGDWSQLLLLLNQASSADERDEVLDLAAVLLRDQRAPAFRLLTLCCQLSPLPTESEMQELLRDSALFRELGELELWRMMRSYRLERLRYYAGELQQQAALYLQTRLPSLEALCLRLLHLFSCSSDVPRKELLSLLFSYASDALRERLLLIWPATEVEAVADLIRNCASKGDPFFLRTRLGLFFYHQAVCQVLTREEKRRLLATWLERQLDPLDLQALLAYSELTPDERAWLLERYGPLYLSHPDYARCWQLANLAQLYLLSLGPADLRRPETKRLLETLATPKVVLPSLLISLSWSWLRVATALEKRQVDPYLDKALGYLKRALDPARYAALYKELLSALKLSKGLKKKKVSDEADLSILGPLKPEGLPKRRSVGLPLLKKVSGLFARRRGLHRRS